MDTFTTFDMIIWEIDWQSGSDHGVESSSPGCIYPDTWPLFLVQVPAIAAVYAGTDALPAAVEAAVRAQQNNDTSVKLGLAAARVLEQVNEPSVCTAIATRHCTCTAGRSVCVR
jgi:hypothetical protein